MRMAPQHSVSGGARGVRRTGLAGVDETAERLGDAADGLLVTLLGEAQAVAVLAVGFDHTVDVLPRLPVRIRRLRHV